VPTARLPYREREEVIEFASHRPPEYDPECAPEYDDYGQLIDKPECDPEFIDLDPPCGWPAVLVDGERWREQDDYGRSRWCDGESAFCVYWSDSLARWVIGQDGEAPVAFGPRDYADGEPYGTYCDDPEDDGDCSYGVATEVTRDPYGQCVQVCPVQAIKLADLVDGFGVGTPHIDARAQACDFSCDAVQCILACPTGSLTYHKPAFLPVRPGAPLAAKPVLLAKEKDAEPTLNLQERIGVARLPRPESCLAQQGKGFKGQARGPGFKGELRYMEVDRWKPIKVADHPYEVELCDLCVRACPIKGAISIETVFAPDGSQRKSPVVHEPCVGCGVCEMICPTEPASIEIIPGEGWRA
jgi:ferredoxin-type protein NapG